MRSLKILRASSDMLSNSILLQSRSRYLSLPNLKLNYGLSSSITGSHLPMSMFQQLALITPLSSMLALLPNISTSDLVSLSTKSNSGTGSSVMPICSCILWMDIAYLVIGVNAGGKSCDFDRWDEETAGGAGWSGCSAYEFCCCWST